MWTDDVSSFVTRKMLGTFFPLFSRHLPREFSLSYWGLGEKPVNRLGPHPILSVDPGYGGSADRQIVRPPWGDILGWEALVKMGDPLSPPMSRDMISANLTFQLVPTAGRLWGEGGMGCGGPAQPSPGAGLPRKGDLGAGQPVRPARRHGRA